MTAEGLRHRFAISLRYALMACFVVVSVVPPLLLLGWFHEKSVEERVSDASERNTLMAIMLARHLGTYGTEVRHLVAHAWDNPDLSDLPPGLQANLLDVHVAAICRLNGEGAITQLWSSDEWGCLPAEPGRLEQELQGQSDRQIVFTPVLKSESGKYFLFLVKREKAGGITAARVDNGYLKDIQSAITFGGDGHAAIVDQLGQVISHPRSDWELSAKNLSTVPPVKAMMAGETGASRFFSPAANLTMIAGFAAVPETGWGIMVPQPESTTFSHVRENMKTALLMLALGTLPVIAFSWWLSGRLARPLEALAEGAVLVGRGEFTHRFGNSGFFRETRELEDACNAMSQSLERQTAERDMLLSDLRGMRKDLEIRVRERTLELTHEVTIRRQAEQQAVESLQQATLANKAKTQFLAHMSHELRTPLNAIIGFSDVLRMGEGFPVSDAQRLEYCDIINESGVHLLTLINDLLDVTRIETGVIQLNLEPLDLTSLIGSCVQIMSARATDAGIDLVTEIAPGLPHITGDEARLRQVILNLLSNAVKFTGKQGQVTVQVMQSSAYPSCIEIYIRDTGVGISEADMQKIMEPFGQVANAQVKDHDGVGLGLPLANALTNLHDGRLSLESNVGKGTVVLLRLPITGPVA